MAPLGAFVVVHLATTATAIGGAARFDRVFASTPLLTALTLILVVAPLAFHAAYGGYLAAVRPFDLGAPGWWVGARRAAALITLLFVVGHVLELPLRSWTGALRSASIFDATTAHLSSTRAGVPLVALAYVVGLAATLFHLATSLWTFATTWGLVLAPGRRRALAWGLGALASILFLVGGNTIVYFATGNRLVGSASPFVPAGPPLAPCEPRP